MAMKTSVLIVVGSFLVASGCHAGWLKTDQPGIVIQTGGDPSVTTRLAVVEAAVAEMPTRDFNVMGGGLTWSVCAPSRNWTGAALSADGRHQTAVVQWGSIYVSGDYGASWTAKETAHDWGAVAVSADGSRQTACVYDGQMYFSTNYGSTWTTGGESFCWVSVAMSANGERQTAVVDNDEIDETIVLQFQVISHVEEIFFDLPVDMGKMNQYIYIRFGLAVSQRRRPENPHFLYAVFFRNPVF